MKARVAVINRQPSKESPGKYEVTNVELDEPRQGELLVKLAATGLCHSDDHAATGDMPLPFYPFIGGREGAGVVQHVGPNKVRFDVGDHVIFSFIPGCGRCRWCASGMQNLCDLGAKILSGERPEEPDSFRVHLADGTIVGQMSGIGTFSDYTKVSVNSDRQGPSS
jgi:Zn-dependent alcohol dehydrogenase